MIALTACPGVITYPPSCRGYRWDGSDKHTIKFVRPACNAEVTAQGGTGRRGNGRVGKQNVFTITQTVLLTIRNGELMMILVNGLVIVLGWDRDWTIHRRPPRFLLSPPAAQTGPSILLTAMVKSFTLVLLPLLLP